MTVSTRSGPFFAFTSAAHREINIAVNDSSHPMSGQLLSVPQVAEKLAVSPSLVYLLIESGRLAHHRIGTGRGTIRVSPVDLEAYLASCHAEADQRQSVARPLARRLKHLRL